MSIFKPLSLKSIAKQQLDTYLVLLDKYIKFYNKALDEYKQNPEIYSILRQRVTKLAMLRVQEYHAFFLMGMPLLHFTQIKNTDGQEVSILTPHDLITEIINLELKIKKLNSELKQAKQKIIYKKVGILLSPILLGILTSIGISTVLLLFTHPAAGITFLVLSISLSISMAPKALLAGHKIPSDLDDQLIDAQNYACYNVSKPIPRKAFQKLKNKFLFNSQAQIIREDYLDNENICLPYAKHDPEKHWASTFEMASSTAQKIEDFKSKVEWPKLLKKDFFEFSELDEEDIYTYYPTSQGRLTRG